MEFCLQHQIWLNFLPAHTSQVLQPLDLGPFGWLKRRFRSHIRQICYASLTPVAGKGEFIQAWKKARDETLRKDKVKTGWSATGIFPRDRSKPLNSRLVRQSDAQTEDAAISGPSSQASTDFLLQTAPAVAETPKTARQLKILVENLGGGDDNWQSPTSRLLFRKVAKGLDESTAKLQELEHRNEQLLAALVKQRPQKRRDVIPKPQRSFVSLADVLEVKVSIEAEGS